MNEVVIRLRGVRIDCTNSQRCLLRMQYGFIAISERYGNQPASGGLARPRGDVKRGGDRREPHALVETFN